MSLRRREGRNGNMGVETLNAAATAIASLENRVPHQASISRRRWGRCWSPYACCFGGPTKRIGHEPASRSPRLLLPFTAAPPSSPASFVPSEPDQYHSSPTGPNMFSPIFVTGPYAHDTQLVSPPVFSTGPCTPPPDSTPPSSPEVPFARFLEFRSYHDTDASDEETTGRFWNGKIILDKL